MFGWGNKNIVYAKALKEEEVFILIEDLDLKKEEMKKNQENENQFLTSTLEKIYGFTDSKIEIHNNNKCLVKDNIRYLRIYRNNDYIGLYVYNVLDIDLNKLGKELSSFYKAKRCGIYTTKDINDIHL